MWKSDRIKAENLARQSGLLRDLLKDFDSIDSLEKLDAVEMRAVMTGKYDAGNAVLSTFPGAGGDDANDWSKMLLQMYTKFAENRKWKISEVDENTIEIKGQYAFGFLKNEAGVHRLVRISPFDAKKLRHTAFALVEVLPDIEKVDEDKMEIPEKDLKFEFSRSSGPGGQNVNKVETAVRVIHIPTGLSASSQVERSQAQNRVRAIKLLKTRIFKLMEETQAKEVSDLRAKAEPKWGNQIRSYVMHPYKMVKDHRTETETSNVDGVLNGELDEFIETGLQLTDNS